MADNKKFIDAAVGYRPQTAFPLNANEYFESLHAAKKAAQMAEEVGTADANQTSYYIGQTLAVYEKGQPVVGEPLTGDAAFRQAAEDAVDRNIPVVLVTLDGSVSEPGGDEGSTSLAAALRDEAWQDYVAGNVDRFYFVYAQKGVDGGLWNAVSRPEDYGSPLTAWYQTSCWTGTDESPMPYAKIAVVYDDGENIQQKFSVNPGDWSSASDFVSFVDSKIGGVRRQPNVMLYQIQPDKTLRSVGSDAKMEVVVDGETIVKNIDTGALKVRTLPDSAVDGLTIKKTPEGKLYVPKLPDSYLTDYVTYDKLTGYVETPGGRNYGIRLGASGAYVYVPWEKGEGGGGGGGTMSADVIVDNRTIGKKPDGTVYLKSVPDEMVQNTGVLFKDWTVPPLGKIRLLASDGSWQYYTYADVAASQGDTGSIGFVQGSSVLEPFASNASLNSPEKIVAVDITDRNVVSLANGAFMGCSCLSSVNCPDVLSVGQDAFYDDDQLATADFKRAEKIQAQAFRSCGNLSAVECRHVQEIGDNAFAECYNLSSFDCPDMQVIGSYAFAECHMLGDIICGNVLSVGSDAFRSTGLGNVEWYNLKQASPCMFVICQNLGSVSIYKVPVVPAGAFYGCSHLSSVYLPDVIEVQESAFMHCGSISGIGVGNISSVGQYAFTGCRALSGLKSENIQNIGISAFCDCVQLSSMNLPSVKHINQGVFAYCRRLSSVTLSGAVDGDSVPTVYSSSFDAIPQTVSVYVLGGMKATFETNADWAALEEAETADPEPHKKIKIIELDIGAGSSTTYTDASGNPLTSVTLLRDGEGVIRDEG